MMEVAVAYIKMQAILATLLLRDVMGLFGIHECKKR